MKLSGTLAISMLLYGPSVSSHKIKVEEQVKLKGKWFDEFGNEYTQLLEPNEDETMSNNDLMKQVEALKHEQGEIQSLVEKQTAKKAAPVPSADDTRRLLQ